MTDKLTMAVIDFGKSATRYHLPYLMLRNQIQVKWIYAHHVDQRPKEQAWYEQQSIQFTTDLDTILADSAVKLVTLCLLKFQARKHDTSVS